MEENNLKSGTSTGPAGDITVYSVIFRNNDDIKLQVNVIVRWSDRRGNAGSFSGFTFLRRIWTSMGTAAKTIEPTSVLGRPLWRHRHRQGGTPG